MFALLLVSGENTVLAQSVIKEMLDNNAKSSSYYVTWGREIVTLRSGIG